jgi:type III pantothenate kinase
MLLAIDIGNTSTSLGIYKNKTLLHCFTINTHPLPSPDEYGVLILNLFQSARLSPSDILASIICSVVPPILPIIERALVKYLGITPKVVGPGTRTGISILYDNPREVGPDRIVNAVAAYEKVRGPVIIVDFGTATTFDYVSKNKEYLGGAIVPGIEISAEALFKQTAMLPKVEIAKPLKVIGRNTIDSIQAGIFYGYLALVDGLAQRMIKEVGGRPKVIGTGGLAPLFKGESRVIDEVDETLTLDGLRILYELNL